MCAYFVGIVTRLVLPFVGIWLTILVPTRDPAVAAVGTLLLGTFLFPLALASLYKSRLLPRYPFLQVSSVRVCPLCGENIVRERFTTHLLLLPYTFKTLRHYESRHQDLSKDAHKVRMAGTMSVNAAIFLFAGVWAWKAWYESPSQTPVLEVIVVSFIAFLVAQFLAWIVVRHVLVTRKGKILGL